MKTVIVVHGTMWAIPGMLAEASVAGVKNAVQAGNAVLKNGGSATDAVEKAVRGHENTGAVALDSLGNVACATSTGGIRNKMVGRVGDSPIIVFTSLQRQSDEIVFNAGGYSVVCAAP
ncbi:hypothetical protein cypCar_00004007 [Cyprinus carpio]|nr:hypothetical protein cypCar_00004007 [Cyprinus carpio]